MMKIRNVLRGLLTSTRSAAQQHNITQTRGHSLTQHRPDIRLICLMVPLTLLSFASNAAVDDLAKTDKYAQPTTEKRLSNAERCHLAAYTSVFDQHYDRDSLYFCNKAIRFDSLTKLERAKAYNSRGILLKNMVELRRAASDFRRASLLLRRSPDIQVNLGNLAYLRGEFEDARQRYNRALNWRPLSPDKAYLNRGLTHERLGETSAALLDYQHALSSNPDASTARDQLQFIISAGPIAGGMPLPEASVPTSSIIAAL